jgi:acetyltransferase
LKGLNPELLARFTQIDYDREIALVALDETAQTDDSMLGVARIIGEPDGKTGEFSVLVGDAWQGKGIGSSLLERCLAIAQKQGYETVHGIVLRENRNMLALGKNLGFEIEKDPDSCDCNLVIHFGKIEPETRRQLNERI